MSEATTILAEEAVPYIQVVNAPEASRVMADAARRVTADLREKAVLLNAEGWQSGPVEGPFQRIDEVTDPLALRVWVGVRMTLRR